MVESNAATRLNRGGVSVLLYVCNEYGNIFIHQLSSYYSVQSLLDDILILHLEDGKDSFVSLAHFFRSVGTIC